MGSSDGICKILYRKQLELEGGVFKQYCWVFLKLKEKCVRLVEHISKRYE